MDEKCSEKIKLAIMEHLNREYGMTEADFLSAELCCVPAFNACDIGFDRSLSARTATTTAFAPIRQQPLCSI